MDDIDSQSSRSINQSIIDQFYTVAVMNKIVNIFHKLKSYIISQWIFTFNTKRRHRNHKNKGHLKVPLQIYSFPVKAEMYTMKHYILKELFLKGNISEVSYVSSDITYI